MQLFLASTIIAESVILNTHKVIAVVCKHRTQIFNHVVRTGSFLQLPKDEHMVQSVRMHMEKFAVAAVETQ